MGVTLKSFRQITNGFARGHHFNMGILDWKDPAFSSIMSKIVGIATTPILSTFCSSMSIPAKSISSTAIRVQHGVPPVNIANDITYPPWTVSFYSDEIMMLRYFFLRWMEGINNSDDKSFGMPHKYKSKLAYAAILTPQDIPCQVFTFKGLYPSEVSNISLGQDSTDVLKFDVTFTYDFFEVNELIGFGIAVAHEFLGSALVNAIGGGGLINKPRKINAPLGISLPIPF